MQVKLIGFIYEFENSAISYVSTFTIVLTLQTCILFRNFFLVLVSAFWTTEQAGFVECTLNKGYEATSKSQNPSTMHVSFYTLSYYAIHLCVYDNV